MYYLSLGIRDTSTPTTRRWSTYTLATSADQYTPDGKRIVWKVPKALYGGKPSGRNVYYARLNQLGPKRPL